MSFAKGPDSYLVKIITKFDASGLRMANRAFAGLQSGFARIGNSIVNFGKRMAQAFVVANIAAMRVFAAATEMENRLTLAFGSDKVDELHTWAAELSKVTGRAEVDIRGIMADIGIFASTSFGTDKKGLIAFSKEVAQLTLGLDSLLDVPTEQAFEAIRSGMAKMIRPLRRLGVNLTDDALRLYAFKEGIIKSTKATFEGRKRYEALVGFIKQQMPMAYGFDAKAGKEITDAERTITSLWNRLKGMWGFLKDLGVEWGAQANAGLQLADTIGLINLGLKDFENKIKSDRPVEKHFSKFRDILKNVVTLFQSLDEGKLAVSDSWGKLGKSVTEAFKPITNLFDDVLNSPGYQKFREGMNELAFQVGLLVGQGFEDAVWGSWKKALKFLFMNKDFADEFWFGPEDKSRPGMLTSREVRDLGRMTGLVPEPYIPGPAKRSRTQFNDLSNQVNSWGKDTEILQQIADNTAKIPELKAE